MTSTVDLTDSTFVVNFRILPTRPKIADISDFLTKKLGFELSQLKHLQIIDSRVFVGTDSPQMAQDIVQEHNLKHQLQQDGKSYYIPLSMEDGAVEVRMHEIRPRISNRQVAQRMREFGEVLSIREDVWRDHFPGIPNGIRLLRMKLQKPIPSYISVENERTLVTYKGQVATCKFCNRRVHYNLKCSEYAKTLKTPSVNQRLTMAQVLAGSTENDSDPFIVPKAPAKNNRIKKSALFMGSNISLAGSDISISSGPEERAVLPSTATLFEQPASSFSNYFAVLGNDDEVEMSPLDGSLQNENESQGKIVQQQSSQSDQRTRDHTPSNNTNVKRPAGSPLRADNQSNDKRPSRSHNRSETRSSSRTSKH